VIIRHIFFFLFVTSVCFSQDSLQKHRTRTQIELGYLIAPARVPFWLQAHQFGTAPKSSALMCRITNEGVHRLGSNKSRWAMSYGLELALNIGSKSSGSLAQVYTGLHYKNWELYAGRKREYIGFADSTLGTGSYAVSGNAIPMPKIQIGTTKYITIPHTKGLLAFKGTYAHGWFGTGRYAYGYLLHQKTFYLQVGKDDWRTKFYGGFNHQVQWAGRTFQDQPTVNDRKLPSGFLDYLYAVTGLGGLTGPGRSGNAFDSTNRVGNHLGSIDIGLTIDLKQNQVQLYHQFLYDDGSLYYLANIKDGLNGISVRRLFAEPRRSRLVIAKYNFEFLYTMSQGGFEAGTTVRVWGKDNYFNHAQFYDGWTYKGRVIGTPFFSSFRDTKVVASQDEIDAINNNRIVVLHAGLQGFYGKQISWVAKLSHSRNYGTYNNPYNDVPKQLSGLLRLEGKARWIDWTTAVAFDRGDLYTNTLGIQAGLKKVF
jgi:Capsule assembly protein Wzi